jgi:hypothetical protein
MGAIATTECTTIHRHIGNGPSIIKTFLPAASTTYTIGEFVTIDAYGRVDNTIADDADVAGVVAATVDNSTGAADNTDKMVPIIVQGNVWCDFLCERSGQTYDDAFEIGSQCSAQGDSGTTAAEGQALVSKTGQTNYNFTSLSIQAIPASGDPYLRRGLAFFKGNGCWA